MRATLIYNSGAGSADTISPASLRAGLNRAGYTLGPQQGFSEDELDEALRNPGELVVVAGGDGTVRKVALHPAARQVPLAIVPLGTANNIGWSLGLNGDPLELIEGLSRPDRLAVDLGRVRGPWGKDYFIETFGVGFFPFALAFREPEKTLELARKALPEVLADYEPQHWQLELDGEMLPGAYLLIEVMNMPFTGPRLPLAPDAVLDDGWLDVVLLRSEEREEVRRYLEALVNSDPHEVLRAEFEVRRAKHLKLVWKGTPVRIDEEVRRQALPEERSSAAKVPSATSRGVIEVDILKGALEFWLPGKQ